MSFEKRQVVLELSPAGWDELEAARAAGSSASELIDAALKHYKLALQTNVQNLERWALDINMNVVRPWKAWPNPHIPGHAWIGSAEEGEPGRPKRFVIPFSVEERNATMIVEGVNSRG